MALRDKIMDAAYDLFGEKGYDKTSVAEIIEKAGASKGGFYHHFKSKEEILETITFSYIKRIQIHYRAILKDDHLSITEKLVASYTRVNDLKIGAVKDWEKIRNLYSFKGNHILLRKMGEAFERETADFYLMLIRAGISEGTFDVKYPEALAALWGREVIKFQQMTRHVLTRGRVTEESFFNTLAFNEDLINQQLGLAPKSIELVPMGKDYLEAMRSEMNGKRFNELGGA